eukprot:15455189-Alexandrium_andersonii.AAC.1
MAPCRASLAPVVPLEVAACGPGALPSFAGSSSLALVQPVCGGTRVFVVQPVVPTVYFFHAWPIRALLIRCASLRLLSQG